jgi:pterin-4a-carbinolamine dehydratase
MKPTQPHAHVTSPLYFYSICHLSYVGPNPGYDSMEGDKLEEEMATLLPLNWTLASDRKSISRAFTCRNFKSAVAFINLAAEVAEREDISHHPDLHLTQYRNVEV